MTTSQQRKKTDKAEPPPTTNNKSNTIQSSNTGNHKKDELMQQLDRAQAAVEQSHARTLQLHQQWRTQLLRLSYLVMIVTMHIAQAPSGACIQEIKKWNALQPETLAIPGSEAMILVLHDAMVELLSIFCVGCLLQCLRLHFPQGDFASWPYRLSCAVLPIILGIYFPQASIDKKKNNNNNKERPTCVAASKYYDASLTTADLRDEAVPRHFPVVLVFHLIVSISLSFMIYQNQQHDKNIQLLQRLKQDLREAQQNKKNDDNNNNNNTNTTATKKVNNKKKR